MKCACCDRLLKPEEIKLHPELKQWDYCRVCLEIISEIFEDGADEDEITKQLEFEWGTEYVSYEKVEDTS